MGYSSSSNKLRSAGYIEPLMIHFEGNSLFANYSAYVSSGIYEGVKSYRGNMGRRLLAVNARTQTLINANIATNITPYVRPNDIIFLWEGTNDMDLNGLSGANAFARVVTYINSVSSLSPQLIIGTVISRDDPTDAADLMTRIAAYNTLVRDNAATYGYTVADFAANSLFDTRADASNTTYYESDKLHLEVPGRNEIITMGVNAIASIL